MPSLQDVDANPDAQLRRRGTGASAARSKVPRNAWRLIAQASHCLRCGQTLRGHSRTLAHGGVVSRGEEGPKQQRSDIEHRRIGSSDPCGSHAARHQGGRMPTVFGYHDVKDKDHWLASPKREEFFGPLGVTNIRTFVDPENSTRVGVLMDVADMDAVMSAMETDAAAEAMAYDGVLPETLVILVEA